MTRKVKLRGLLTSEEAWEAMEAGRVVKDETTELRYKILDGRLMVQDPFGSWVPNIKPIEWFMITYFKVVHD